MAVFGGVFLVVLSFLSGTYLLSYGISSDDGEHVGLLVMHTGDLFVRAKGNGDDTFSLHLFDFEVGATVWKEGSMDNVTALASIEHVNEFVGVVHLPSSGAYLLVVTLDDDNTSRRKSVSMTIWRATPHLRVLWTGTLLVVAGIVVNPNLVRNAWRRMKSRWEVPMIPGA